MECSIPQLLQNRQNTVLAGSVQNKVAKFLCPIAELRNLVKLIKSCYCSRSFEIKLITTRRKTLRFPIVQHGVKQ
jgi:hypothetical protein